MTASRSGNLEVVRLLLARGADVNAKETVRGQTALMWAVAQRHSGVVRVLLEAGADVQARTKEWYQLVNPTGGEDGTGATWVRQGGFTPLLFAAREGARESVEVLLGRGERE